jgi:hypothetical protein
MINAEKALLGTPGFLGRYSGVPESQSRKKKEQKDYAKKHMVFQGNIRHHAGIRIAAGYGLF